MRVAAPGSKSPAAILLKMALGSSEARNDPGMLNAAGRPARAGIDVRIPVGAGPPFVNGPLPTKGNPIGNARAPVEPGNWPDPKPKPAGPGI